jgi:hypothetical protein
MSKGWKGVIDRAADPAGLGDQLANNSELAVRPYAFMCPKDNCYYAVSAQSKEEAEKIREEHECPYIGGITHIGSSVTATLLEQAWEKADLVYDRLCSAETEEQSKPLAAQLNGMCQVIALFMPPLMRTPAEVGTEIRKRKNMRDAGEHYETPGLGSRRYESATAGKPRQMPAAERATKVLSEQERKAIKFAMDSKMFKAEQLAATYDVTVEVINAVAAEDNS